MADSQVPVSGSVFAATIAHPDLKSKPTWYIVAKQDATIPPDGERFMGKREGATVIELKGSHLVLCLTQNQLQM